MFAGALALVFVFCIPIAGVLATPVAAQQAQEQVGNISVGPANESGNASEGGNYSGYDGGGGGGLFPDPVAWLADGIAGLFEMVAHGIYGFINGLSVAIFDVPRLGAPGEPATWGNPYTGSGIDGPFWPSVRAGYLITAALGIAVLTWTAMAGHQTLNPRELKQHHGDVAISLVMIVMGWWVLMGAYHLTGAISTALVPDASSLFSTFGNSVKFGLVLLVGAFLVFVNASFLGIAFFVVLVEKFLLLVLFALWPLFWGLRPSRSGLANSAAGVGLGTLAGVLAAKGLQAFFAFLTFNIDWAGVHANEAIAALIGTVVGISVTFVGVPVYIFRNFMPEVITILGTPAVSVAENAAEQTRETVTEKTREVMQDYRGSARADAGNNVEGQTAPPPNYTHRGVSGPSQQTAPPPDGYTDGGGGSSSGSGSDSSESGGSHTDR